jgi:hypothetical protein
VAVVVTVAGFALATGVCGALVLPPVMKDPAIRWGMAGGLGVAVAALAALWGHSFATGEHSAPAGSGNGTTPAPGTTGPGATRNTIRGGTFQGPVIQGRDFSGPITGGPAPDSPAPPSRSPDSGAKD